MLVPRGPNNKQTLDTYWLNAVRAPLPSCNRSKAHRGGLRGEQCLGVVVTPGTTRTLVCAPQVQCFCSMCVAVLPVAMSVRLLCRSNRKYVSSARSRAGRRALGAFPCIRQQSAPEALNASLNPGHTPRRSCWRASASSSRRATRYAASWSTCAPSRTSCACGQRPPPTRPHRCVPFSRPLSCACGVDDSGPGN